MAKGGRGLITEILKNFWESLQPRKITGTKMGSDYFGNTYYEIIAGAKPGNKRGERWFIPKDKEAFDQEMPAEWDAWLRGRRREPPSEEEVERNRKLMETKKENYLKLEEQYRSSRISGAITEQKKTGFESFPTYSEYETSPGEHVNKGKTNNT